MGEASFSSRHLTWTATEENNRVPMSSMSLPSLVLYSPFILLTRVLSLLVCRRQSPQNVDSSVLG